MSTQHPNDAAPATAPARDAAPGAGAAAAPPPHRLPMFLKVSVALLAALSIAAIALVFIGDFEGKVERITSTFLIFAVFVGLTAFDTRMGHRNSWYAPVALIANSYILALLLIVTWMSNGGFYLGIGIFWKAIVVVLVVRGVVACCQLLLGIGDGLNEVLSRFAFITSVLAVLSGILFTAPMAIEVFNVEIPELYWKFGVAALLLTGLGLAITLLVRWSYGAEAREARREERRAATVRYGAPLATPQAPPPPAPTQPLLPWPTFADGRPLPALPNGQPDFSVPGAPPQP